MTCPLHHTNLKHSRACKAILSIKSDYQHITGGHTGNQQCSLCRPSHFESQPTPNQPACIAITKIALPALTMAAASVQNPPTQSESKSSKKKKAKAVAAATERTESPAPAATPDQPASVSGSNDITENAYIRELKK